MKITVKWIAAALLLIVPAAAFPQLALPTVGPVLRLPDQRLDGMTDPFIDPVIDPLRAQERAETAPD